MPHPKGTFTTMEKRGVIDMNVMLKLETYSPGTPDENHCLTTHHVKNDAFDEIRALVLVGVEDIHHPEVLRVVPLAEDDPSSGNAFRMLVDEISRDPDLNQRKMLMLSHTLFTGPDGEKWGDAGLGSWDVKTQRWEDYHFLNPRTGRWENEAGEDVPQDPALWGSAEGTVGR